jgi:Heparinase II/III-like protein
MSSIAWYWHRFRAMTPAELAAHGQRKLRQVSDSLFSERRFTAVRELPGGGTFPQLPKADAAPPALQAALRRDVADILHGRWIAFGYLPLQVDNPPRWHKDYLAGVDLATRQPALKLHHRVEGKADIKVIWEPSRWYSLVRLAQGAYVLGDQRAAAQCLAWLDDWSCQNPPFYGWHWTSALESGLRLIQFVWIEALLSAARRDDHALADGEPRTPPSPQASNGQPGATLAELRARLLPPHLWFTWRNRSFGSSANNHLLGELSGLIVTLAGWPGLARWAAPLATLQPLWEREVLSQFAPDGGNREQALNYHLFSWEFCWQARLALRAAGRNVSPEVEDRLRAAVSYFEAVQVPAQQWDYGDSDSAYVTPFFVEWREAASEWLQWLSQPARSPSIHYWVGDSPKGVAPATVLSGPNNWRIYPETGFAVCRAGDWFLRWDLSPLGYLATAGHGHCDALHVSLWHKGRALVIDPGTGAYHADRPLRDYLASWQAHNGPRPPQLNFPERRGAFLWSAHHQKPRWEKRSESAMLGELALPDGVMRRTVTLLEKGEGWRVDDGFLPAESGPRREVEVFWQLAPEVRLEPLNSTTFRLELGAAVFTLELAGWSHIEHWAPQPGDPAPPDARQLRGSCSPAFRLTQLAPFILLRGDAPAAGRLQTILRQHPSATVKPLTG